MVNGTCMSVGEVLHTVQEAFYGAEVTTSGEFPLVIRVWKSEFDALEIDRLQTKLGIMLYWKSFETYFVLIVPSNDIENDIGK